MRALNHTSCSRLPSELQVTLLSDALVCCLAVTKVSSHMPDEHACSAVTLTGVILAVILFSNELAEYLKPFSLQTVRNAEIVIPPCQHDLLLVALPMIAEHAAAADVGGYLQDTLYSVEFQPDISSLTLPRCASTTICTCSGAGELASEPSVLNTCSLAGTLPISSGKKAQALALGICTFGARIDCSAVWSGLQQISSRGHVAAVLSLDAADTTGEHAAHSSFASNGEIHKIRLNPEGQRIGLGEYIPPLRYGFMLSRPRQVTELLLFTSLHLLMYPPASRQMPVIATAAVLLPFGYNAACM